MGKGNKKTKNSNANAATSSSATATASTSATTSPNPSRPTSPPPQPSQSEAGSPPPQTILHNSSQSNGIPSSATSQINQQDKSPFAFDASGEQSDRNDTRPIDEDEDKDKVEPIADETITEADEQEDRADGGMKGGQAERVSDDGRSRGEKEKEEMNGNGKVANEGKVSSEEQGREEDVDAGVGAKVEGTTEVATIPTHPQQSNTRKATPPTSIPIPSTSNLSLDNPLPSPNIFSDLPTPTNPSFSTTQLAAPPPQQLHSDSNSHPNPISQNDSNHNNHNNNHDEDDQDQIQLLESELAQTRQERDQLNGQYRGLLGKLTQMRSSLGEKLREDAVSRRFRRCRLIRTRMASFSRDRLSVRVNQRQDILKKRVTDDVSGYDSLLGFV